MKKYTVVIEQRQFQVIELEDNIKFNEDDFWDNHYDLGSCEIDSRIVAVDLQEEEEKRSSIERNKRNEKNNKNNTI